MSSMENGRTHCGFRPIRRAAPWGGQQRGGCSVTCPRRTKKKSGGIYDELSPIGQQG